jgi:hypothetical protein
MVSAITTTNHGMVMSRSIEKTEMNKKSARFENILASALALIALLKLINEGDGKGRSWFNVLFSLD